MSGNWRPIPMPSDTDGAAIHFKVSDDGEIHRMLFIGSNPTGPRGEVDGRIAKDENGRKSADLAFTGGSPDVAFDMAALAICRRVVHGNADEKWRVLAAKYVLDLEKTVDQDKFVPVCPSCGVVGRKIPKAAQFALMTNGNEVAVHASASCITCVRDRLNWVKNMSQSTVPEEPSSDIRGPSFTMDFRWLALQAINGKLPSLIKETERYVSNLEKGLI